MAKAVIVNDEPKVNLTLNLTEVQMLTLLLGHGVGLTGDNQKMHDAAYNVFLTLDRVIADLPVDRLPPSTLGASRPIRFN